MDYSEWLGNMKRAHLELKTPLAEDADSINLKYIDTELLLKEFHLHVDLVKHYLDLVIKFNVFYYAVTGALLSYYFTKYETERLVRWSLILPIMMSLFFGILFVRASRAIPQVDVQLSHLSRILNFAKPEVQVLRYAMIGSGLLFIGAGIALALMFIVRT